KSVQLLDDSGQLVCEVWVRKELPADATAEQIKNGLTYREVKQTEILGAIRFPQDGRDYRKQKVKAGVYTLRLGFQPQDGDHMGTAPHPEFLLLTAAKLDTKPATMPIKTLIERSAASIDTAHPAVLLLFPNANAPENPELDGKP